MSLEQKLRENLKTAADALVVPETDTTSSPSHTRRWGSGLRVALAGAAAVMALALPALVLWSGDVPLEDGATPSTGPETVASTGTEVPLSTLAPETTLPVLERMTLSEITVDDYVLVLTTIRSGEQEPPTATVTLQVTRVGATEPADESVVGAADGFFWFVVTGTDAVCEFSAESTAEGAEVSVQVVESQSMGCSDTFQFDLTAGELSPRELAPDEVARQFVAAWGLVDTETMSALAEEVMAELAEAEATRQAGVLPTPVDPLLSYCEGAAGSTYCTFEVADGELVVRVRTERPARVEELISLPGE